MRCFSVKGRYCGDTPGGGEETWSSDCWKIASEWGAEASQESENWPCHQMHEIRLSCHFDPLYSVKTNFKKFKLQIIEFNFVLKVWSLVRVHGCGKQGYISQSAYRHPPNIVQGFDPEARIAVWRRPGQRGVGVWRCKDLRRQQDHPRRR